MLMNCMKGRLSTDNPESVPPILKITIDSHRLVELCYLTAEQRYPFDHIFLKDYLKPMINPNNQDLGKQFVVFKDQVNSREFSLEQTYEFCMRWVKQEKSPVSLMLQLWQFYLDYELKKTSQNLHQFLIHQINLFTQTVVSFIRTVQPKVALKKDIIRFQMHLLDIISRFKLFSRVMQVYLTDFSKMKGVKYQFSKSEVESTKTEFEKSLGLSKIYKPFVLTIKKLEQFNAQSTLVKKIHLLVEAVEQARNDIAHYRQGYGDCKSVFGADQVITVINYACQKANNNILASAGYIDVFIGHNSQVKRQLLHQVTKDADYSLNLVQTAGSVYCHASQIY